MIYSLNQNASSYRVIVDTNRDRHILFLEKSVKDYAPKLNISVKRNALCQYKMFPLLAV